MKYVLILFFAAAIPIEVAKWVFPLCKALHNGNYRKFLVIERNECNLPIYK